MTPAARLAAAIEVIEAVDRHGPGADRLISEYFRKRRYAGAKDRAAVAHRVYSVLRHQRRLGWWLDRVDCLPNVRTRILADLVVAENRSTEDIAAVFDGSDYGPIRLSDDEQSLLKRLAGNTLDHPDMPLAVRGECPDWLASRLQTVFGPDTATCLAAFDKEAGLDLRLNPLKCQDREGARNALRSRGLDTVPTVHSPFGLRARRRRPLDSLAPYKSGLVEVQDEGAQLAALLVAAKPGMQVVDYCAGAGGKALLLGALMRNRGRVLATDISAERLDRAQVRISRSGLHNIERRVLNPDRSRFLKRWSGRFDRVLVDAPCSGVGTWRRNPEARWRYDEAGLSRMTALQDEILGKVARLTRRGGRLIYVTCSLLREENQDRVAAFLQAHRDYRLLPIAPIWQETVTRQGGGTLAGSAIHPAADTARARNRRLLHRGHGACSDLTWSLIERRGHRCDRHLILATGSRTEWLVVEFVPDRTSTRSFNRRFGNCAGRNRSVAGRICRRAAGSIACRYERSQDRRGLVTPHQSVANA